MGLGEDDADVVGGDHAAEFTEVFWGRRDTRRFFDHADEIEAVAAGEVGERVMESNNGFVGDAGAEGEEVGVESGQLFEVGGGVAGVASGVNWVQSIMMSRC